MFENFFFFPTGAVRAVRFSMHPTHPQLQKCVQPMESEYLLVHADTQCRPIFHDGNREYPVPAANSGRERAIRRQSLGCFFIATHSSSVRAPGLRRISSGTPILPISCKSAPQRTCTSSSSLKPKTRARSIVICVTRRVCPSVSLSRKSRARDQPSIVAS